MPPSASLHSPRLRLPRGLLPSNALVSPTTDDGARYERTQECQVALETFRAQARGVS